MDVVSNLPYCCGQLPTLEDISIRYLLLSRFIMHAEAGRKIWLLVSVNCLRLLLYFSLRWIWPIFFLHVCQCCNNNLSLESITGFQEPSKAIQSSRSKCGERITKTVKLQRGMGWKQEGEREKEVGIKKKMGLKTC